MAAALVGLLLVAYLPGALIYRIPVARRSLRSRLPADERVFWAIVLSSALTTVVVLGLAALASYTFQRLLACNAGLATLIAVVWRGRLRYGGEARRPTWAALIPVTLVALGLTLYFPPSEYIMGGKDPGVYMNEGIQIAQRGSLTIPDWTLAAVPADLRDLFLTDVPSDREQSLHEGVRFMGFFVTDRARGEVVGQFPHGFPAWIAIGYGLDGLTGARRAVGFWALLGLLAVYFAGARLVGPLPAAAGVALLSLNVAQVWFGRYPNSEVMQQAVFFSAMLALARSSLDGDRFFAPVAGALLGLMVFTRFDAIILIAAVGGGLVLLVAEARPLGARLFVPLVFLLGLAVPYYSHLMRAYISIPLLKLGGPRGILGMAAALIVLALSAWALRIRFPAVLQRARAVLPAALIVAVVSAAIYAAWLREPFETIYDATGVVIWQGVAEHDAYALRVYAWYVGAVVIAAAILGFVVVVWRSFWRDPVLLSVTAAVSMFFFYKLRIVPEHFWQARRYLPVILPMTCVLAAAGAFARVGVWRENRGVIRRGRHVFIGTVRVVLPVIIVGFMGWHQARQTRPILDHVEYAGLIPSIEKLASRFTDRDLLLVESRNSSDIHVLATPLAYIYAKNVLLLSSPRPDPARFEQLLDWARPNYDRVVLLADGGTDLANSRLSATPLDLYRFRVAEYESSRDMLPQQVRQKKFSVGVYVISIGESTVRMDDLDVGGLDDLWVLRMHAKEQGVDTTYRWTRDVSYVSLQGISERDRNLRLRMYNGGRPGAAGPATVEIQWHDRSLGTVTVEGGWRDYLVAIPPELAADALSRPVPTTIRLMCSTWSPKAILGGADDRVLGVMLDRVRVE